MINKLLNIDEVADLLGVSSTTLRNKQYRKRIGLNSIRIGRSIRFSKEELDDFISRNVELACIDAEDQH